MSLSRYLLDAIVIFSFLFFAAAPLMADPAVLSEPLAGTEYLGWETP
jgi:hypothetical protein